MRIHSGARVLAACLVLAAASGCGNDDAGPSDAGPMEAGLDASREDASDIGDAGEDSGADDAGAPDAGAPDAGAPDAGAPSVETWTQVLDFGDADSLDAVLGVPDAPAWIVAGTSTRLGADRIWLGRVDAVGAVAWSRLVSLPTSVTAGRASLAPVAGGFAVAATSSGNVLVARFDFDGNPLTGAIMTSTFVYDTGSLVLGSPVVARAAADGLLLAADASRGPFLARFDAATVPTFARGGEELYPPRPVAIFDQPGGGFVLAAESSGGSGASGGLELLAFAADESLTWGWRYGDTGTHYLRDAIRTADGGYLLVGSIDQRDARGLDLLLVRTDTDGTVRWQKAYGEAQTQVGRAAIERSGGAGFVVTGTTVTTGATGSIDAWVIAVTADGALDWQWRYGGAGRDEALALDTSASGGFLVAGRTTSTSATGDGWLLRLAEDGSIDGCPVGLGSTTAATAADTATPGVAHDLVRRARTPAPIAASPGLGVLVPDATAECTGP